MYCIFNDTSFHWQILCLRLHIRSHKCKTSNDLVTCLSPHGPRNRQSLKSLLYENELTTPFAQKPENMAPTVMTGLNYGNCALIHDLSVHILKALEDCVCMADIVSLAYITVFFSLTYTVRNILDVLK